MTLPYSTLILVVFPLDQIADIGISPSTGKPYKLFSRTIRSILTYGITVPERHVTDIRTDGRTTYCGIAALCVASRVKYSNH